MISRTRSHCKKIVSLTAIASALFCLGSPTVSLADDVGFQVTGTQHLDGEPRWDYLTVDALNHHLFITHGTQIDVFNLNQKKVTDVISGTDGVHGIALAPNINRGYASNGKSNSVMFFELSTLKIIGTVPTGKKPDAIIYDNASNRVFAANGESANLTPIDTTSGNSMDPIPLGGKPEFEAVDGRGHLFVNLEDKNELVVVDTRKMKITDRYNLADSCDEPAGLAIDVATNRLFVGCHNQKMVVVDGKSGKILSQLEIGKDNDAVAFDPVEKLAFASNGDGTLTVVGPTLDGTHYAVKQTVVTLPSARTMAIDPVTHNIYLVAGEYEPEDPSKPQKPGTRRPFKPNSFTLMTVVPRVF